jgi:hypothetical protein
VAELRGGGGWGRGWKVMRKGVKAWLSGVGGAVVAGTEPQQRGAVFWGRGQI